MKEVFESAKSDLYKQSAIIRGILELKLDEIRREICWWRYLEGKKRTINGKVYNLKRIKVTSNYYSSLDPFKVFSEGIFVLDPAHVKADHRKEAIDDICHWLSCGAMPINERGKYKDLYITVKKEMTFEDVLAYGYKGLMIS